MNLATLAIVSGLTLSSYCNSSAKESTPSTMNDVNTLKTVSIKYLKSKDSESTVISHNSINKIIKERSIAAIKNTTTGAIFILKSNATLYFEYKTKIKSLTINNFNIEVSSALGESSANIKNESDALTEFESNVVQKSTNELKSADKFYISLIGKTPKDFFITKESSAQSGALTPKLLDAKLSGDNLIIKLQSNHSESIGEFTIDVKNKLLSKSVINGKEYQINTEK